MRKINLRVLEPMALRGDYYFLESGTGQQATVGWVGSKQLALGVEGAGLCSAGPTWDREETAVPKERQVTARLGTPR